MMLQVRIMCLQEQKIISMVKFELEFKHTDFLGLKG